MQVVETPDQSAAALVSTKKVVSAADQSDESAGGSSSRMKFEEQAGKPTPKKATVADRTQKLSVMKTSALVTRYDFYHIYIYINSI